MTTKTSNSRRPAPPSLPAHVRVLVVGAGFAGLGAAIKFAEAGIDDYLVIDKGEDVGGTWRDNTYPGAACDVPSQLYSFSFALNPDWSETYSPQPEIQAYIQKVARESGVLDHFRFRTTFEDARWDETDQQWHVATSAGDVTADVVVAAAGALSAPKLPDIDGIDSFEGEVFHSAEWNHDYELAGKRVAVIGTGASAIQIVPEIAKEVAHLDVYQRTAPWILPRLQRPYSRAEKFAFRHIPGAQRAARTGIYWLLETVIGPPLHRNTRYGAHLSRTARAHIARNVRDRELRAKVTPDYTIGCKRILFSNAWYPALSRENVDLVTDPISKITPAGIVTSDGTARDIDALVIATGFHTTDLPIAEHVRGRGGVTMAEYFDEHGMQAYKGSTLARFPNLFFIVGPNTGLGHSSMVFMIESQVAYLVDALKAMDREQIVALEPSEAAQHEWTGDVQRKMKSTVWSTGGCSSWYLDKHGNNTTLWPRTTFAFRSQLRRFDLEKYVVTVRSDVPATKEKVAS